MKERLLLFALLCAISAGAQQPDGRLAGLRAWVTSNEAKTHDFRYTGHQVLTVTAPEGSYRKILGVSFDHHWLNGHNCLSHIVWDDRSAQHPLLDANGCRAGEAPAPSPIAAVGIVKNRIPGLVEAVRLADGQAGLHFVFPAVPAHPQKSYAENCAGATEIEVWANATTYAFVRITGTVKSDVCERGPDNVGTTDLQAGTHFSDDYKTYEDGFTTAVHSVLTAPARQSIRAKNVLGREFSFTPPVSNPVTVYDFTLTNLERLIDVAINPNARPREGK
jgi:hypothetical protein